MKMRSRRGTPPQKAAIAQELMAYEKVGNCTSHGGWLDRSFMTCESQSILICGKLLLAERKKSPDTTLLVTGSAHMETFRQGGDSLAGRYFAVCLHPFSVCRMKSW